MPKRARVQKISSLSFNETNNRFNPSLASFLENDTMAIWAQAVEFIKWYNENKKS